MKKDPCQLCGKRGRFPCPALSGPICSYCCGSGRGSKIDCDPLCSRYPFGTENYDAWLQIDANWPLKMANRLVEDIGPRELERRINAFNPEPEADELSALEGGLYGTLIHGVFWEKAGPRSETRAQRWEEEGWTGLNNDERVMTRFRQHTYFTVLEFQRVTREGLASECLDLLDPARGPFTVYDRAMASQVLPYTRLLSWVTHFPHYSRTGGVAVCMEHSAANDFIAALYEHVGTRDPESVRAHLINHFSEVIALREEIESRHREELITGLDARAYTLTYRINDLQAVQARLDRQAEFLPGYPDDPDPVDWPGQIECYDWIRSGSFSDAPTTGIMKHLATPDGTPGPEVLGNLRLFSERLIAETVGTERANYVRNKLVALFGNLLIFDREMIDDFGERTLQKQEGGSLAPATDLPFDEPIDPFFEARIREPSLAISDLDEEDQERIWNRLADLTEAEEESRAERPDPDQVKAGEAFMQKTYRELLDSPVPALENLSPREASTRPDLANALDDWSKMHIHSICQHRARSGGELDLRWFFEEIGRDHLWTT